MTTSSSQRSVIVIGAGVIGVCSACFLAEKGMRVTLADQDDVCSGSSHGNLTLAAGHAMIGMPSGPESGKLVAQVVVGERPFADMTLLDPGRFG